MATGKLEAMSYSKLTTYKLFIKLLYSERNHILSVLVQREGTAMAAAIKLVVLALVVITGTATANLTKKQIQDMVDHHNYYRNRTKPTAANMEYMVRMLLCRVRAHTHTHTHRHTH